MTNVRPSDRHNRRQRKKLRLGEFQELGIEVSADLASQLTDEARDTWIDEFLEQAIEANGLLFVGGLNDNFWGFVMSEAKYQSVTDDQCTLVLAWLSGRSELTNLKVSAPMDARDAWTKIV